jgi:tRNA (adenine57-N1/adenine58-N1)-methyltransferase
MRTCFMARRTKKQLRSKNLYHRPKNGAVPGAVSFLDRRYPRGYLRQTYEEEQIMIHPGTVVMLVSPKGKRYFKTYVPGDTLNTHDGTLPMDEAVRVGFGGRVETHLGRSYTILRPTLYDLVKSIKRKTQIMYPKEIGYIALKLGIGPGCRVVEAGCGSGGLTTSLAWFVGDTGKVYTYERREEFFTLCRENLDKVGLLHRVEQRNHDIAEGFLQTDADALFLDVRTPWDYLDQAAAALTPGSPIGFLLPTTNQVQDLLAAMEGGPFGQCEVLEILVRKYKASAERFRPDDRMVAHTGFLVFARLLDKHKLQKRDIEPKPLPLPENNPANPAPETDPLPGVAASVPEATGAEHPGEQ